MDFSNSAQVRIVTPGDPNSPPGNTYSTGVVSDLSLTTLSSGRIAASGYVDAYGVGTSSIGIFYVQTIFR